MRIVIIFVLCCLGVFTACKDKKSQLTEKKVEVVKPKQPEPVAVPEEKPKPVVKEMNYFLVAGCFEVYSNAERLNAKLLNEGYDSKILPFYNLSMVTYNGYETREEAQAALNRMVLEPGKAEVWVYPVK